VTLVLETAQVRLGDDAPETDMEVQGPQLFVSLDSAMLPALPAELLSAQARMYQVPALEKVYEVEVVFEPPEASEPFVAVPMSVAFEPLESVARWNRFVKPAPVPPGPPFEILADNVTAASAVAEDGETEPAVRSGWSELTVNVVHGPQLLA
jgi:hypothetical protein